MADLGITLRSSGADQVEGDLRRVNAGLNSVEQSTKRMSAGTDANTISVGQMNAALRQVPAQLQDIVVSLQGGQKPLTGFLQQGSQLASSFGSVGTAAKAVGGYLLGLINPFTLAAAAATAGSRHPPESRHSYDPSSRTTMRAPSRR